jgi:hypothetical protein
MTAVEIKKFVRKAKDITKKATASKEASQQFLIATGIYTKKGKLKRPFNGHI